MLDLKNSEVQKWYGPHLSPCQVWWGLDFTCRRGQKRSMFFVYLER